jgi:hypothetical protein
MVRSNRLSRNTQRKCCSPPRVAAATPLLVCCAPPAAVTGLTPTRSFFAPFGPSIAPFEIIEAPPGSIIGPDPVDPENFSRIFMPGSDDGLLRASIAAPSFRLNSVTESFCVCVSATIGDPIDANEDLEFGVRSITGNRIAFRAAPTESAFWQTAVTNTGGTSGGGTTIAIDPDVVHDFQFCAGPLGDGSYEVVFFIDGVQIASNIFPAAFFVDTLLEPYAHAQSFGDGNDAELRLDSYCANAGPGTIAVVS